MTDREIVEYIRDHFEGSAFTDRPHDRGGPTKYGVTQDTLGAYWGRPATQEQVAALTAEQAATVLEREFVQRPHFSAIADWLLRFAVVDYGIHSGPGRAAKALQLALGVAQDGVVGPGTLAALDAIDTALARDRVLASRLRFLGHLIDNDRTQVEHAAGWLNRVAAILEAA